MYSCSNLLCNIAEGIILLIPTADKNAHFLRMPKAIHPTSRASIVFLSEEEKRRHCLNHIKPLRSPHPKLQD